MRAVIQRVLEAKVEVDSEVIGKIGKGFLTLIGISHDDDENTAKKLIEKVSKLRVFEDSDGKMNLSLLDIKGENLIVSQFTLCGDTSQGNRPGFSKAAKPEIAKVLYDKSLEISRALGIQTQSGRFQADMKVSLVNDGPVTLIVEV